MRFRMRRAASVRRRRNIGRPSRGEGGGPLGRGEDRAFERGVGVVAAARVAHDAGGVLEPTAAPRLEDPAPGDRVEFFFSGGGVVAGGGRRGRGWGQRVSGGGGFRTRFRGASGGEGRRRVAIGALPPREGMLTRFLARARSRSGASSDAGRAGGGTRTRGSTGGRWSARLCTRTAWGARTRPSRSPRTSCPSRCGTRAPRGRRRRRRRASRPERERQRTTDAALEERAPAGFVRNRSAARTRDASTAEL